MLAALLTMLAQDGVTLPQDLVHLAKGKPVAGVILRMDEQQLWLAQGSRIKTIPRADVTGLEGPRTVYAEYVRRLREHFHGNPPASSCLEMARWCREQQLTRDVDLFYLHALVTEPGNAEAHEALGHSLRRGVWMVKVGNGGTVEWEELQNRARDFASPWEIRTFHYDLKAAGELAAVLRAAAELEQLYHAFFQTLQHDVGFYEVQEIMPVHVYPDLTSFPKQSSILDAYFHRDTRTLHSYFSDGAASSLLHEATHGLLYFTAKELGRKEPSLPGWIDEGLASYLAACLPGEVGSRSFEPGRWDTALLRDHAGAERPDDLTRVLNYDVSDFGASTGQRLKYGQSYTLVQFLLHGGGEEQRADFLRFVAGAYQSKGSMSHFKKALDLNELDELQASWFAYVKDAAAKN